MKFITVKPRIEGIPVVYYRQRTDANRCQKLECEVLSMLS